jgi:hypothetical protein
MKLKVLLFPAWLSLTGAMVLAQGALPSAVRTKILLDPPATAVARSDAVNVRGQPAFNGEVLGRLKKGEKVTVEAEITLGHPQKGEPAQWSQIAMPAQMAVWVDRRFIDSAGKKVKARKINLRGGPGENFSIVGGLERGAAVEAIRRENGWLAIRPPTNAYAFVAAGLLALQPAPAPEAPPPELVNVPPAAVPVPDVNAPPATVSAPAGNEPAPAAPAPTGNEQAPAAPAPTAQGQADQELAALRQATVVAPPAAPAPGSPAETSASTTNTVTPRIVTREGYVHKAYNVQAPGGYELHDLATDRLIEYLQPPANINFRAFVGTRVTVTGPELVDTRWPRTPILQVQSVGLIP